MRRVESKNGACGWRLRLVSGVCAAVGWGCDASALDAALPSALAPRAPDAGVVASQRALRVEEIQGIGHRSPWEGREIYDLEGVVTHVDSTGFTVQSDDDVGGYLGGEGVAAVASAALRVYTRRAPSVRVGDRVLVDGYVVEHRSDCDDYAARGQRCPYLSETQIEAQRTVIVASEQTLPAARHLASRDPAMPDAWLPDAGLEVEGERRLEPGRWAVDWLESLERMRVSLPRVVVVQPSRGGEAVVAAAGDVYHERGVLRSTHAEELAGIGVRRWAIVSPNSATEFDVGDVLEPGLDGVIGYRFGRYRIHLSELPHELRRSQASGVRPERSVLGPAADNELTLGTWNVHELHGASSNSRFEALAEAWVDALAAPDVMTLQEIGDDSGSADDGHTHATRTLQQLRDEILVRSGVDYQIVDLAPQDGADGGRPGVNIRSVLLYRTDRGVRYGFEQRRERLSLPNGMADARRATRFGEQHPAFAGSRKPLLVPFSFRGADFWVIALHLRSKLGDDPLLGRSNPPKQHSAAQRSGQAAVIASLVHHLQLSSLAAPVLVIGDLNDEEDGPAVQVLEEQQLICQTRWLPFADRYSYIYQGRAMMLDHALATPDLAARLTGIDVVHGCVERADCVSDHDPLLIRYAW